MEVPGGAWNCYRSTAPSAALQRKVARGGVKGGHRPAAEVKIYGVECWNYCMGDVWSGTYTDAGIMRQFRSWSTTTSLAPAPAPRYSASPIPRLSVHTQRCTRSVTYRSSLAN